MQLPAFHPHFPVVSVGTINSLPRNKVQFAGVECISASKNSTHLALPGVSQLARASSCNWKVAGLIPGMGRYRRQPIHASLHIDVSLSLPSSHPFSLSLKAMKKKSSGEDTKNSTHQLIFLFLVLFQVALKGQKPENTLLSPSSLSPDPWDCIWALKGREDLPLQLSVPREDLSPET